MLRYLKGTTDHGIMFGRVNNATSKVLGYVDSDFAANLDKRRSFTGCIFTLYRRAMSWKASLLSVVALSTNEEEYIALIEAIKEAIWLKGLVYEQLEQSSVTINYDSSSPIWLSKNLQNHERTKHVAIRFHFIRDEIGRGVVNVIRITTEINPTNMLRKPLYHFFFLILLLI